MLRVAIVDDIASDRDQLAHDLRRSLALLGTACSISVYTSAEDFLGAFADEPVDLAFLDVRMGEGMDGIQLADRLRALDRRLVIVFVTSSREFALDAYGPTPSTTSSNPTPSSGFAMCLTMPSPRVPPKNPPWRSPFPTVASPCCPDA